MPSLLPVLNSSIQYGMARMPEIVPVYATHSSVSALFNILLFGRCFLRRSRRGHRRMRRKAQWRWQAMPCQAYRRACTIRDPSLLSCLVKLVRAAKPNKDNEEIFISLIYFSFPIGPIVPCATPRCAHSPPKASTSPNDLVRLRRGFPSCTLRRYTC